MPHQCLECGETFREGSVEILDGCPECEGTRFFHTDEGLDADEREDLREQTQETVKEAIQEAMEDPDDEVWSWERREEWLRLDPDEAREVLHDVMGDDGPPEDEAPAPTVKDAVRDLPERAPDPEDGTTLSFPEAPDPDAGAPDAGSEPAQEGDEPADDLEPSPTADLESEGPSPDPGEAEGSDRVTPAELANAAREGEADEPAEPETEAPDPPTQPAADGSPEEPGTQTGPEGRPGEPVAEPGAPPETSSPPEEAPPTEPPSEAADPNPDPDELPTRQPKESDRDGDGRVGTVNVEEPGRYDIDVESLLDTSPVIIEKDGHYMVHLPSVFHSVDEDEGAR